MHYILIDYTCLVADLKIQFLVNSKSHVNVIKVIVTLYNSTVITLHGNQDCFVFACVVTLNRTIFFPSQKAVLENSVTPNSAATCPLTYL